MWIEILDEATPNSCFLSLAEANVDDAQNKPLQAATRYFPKVLINSDCCLYSQHFRGCENKVAYHLSRNFDLTSKLLENLIFPQFSSQAPSTFRIVPIPIFLSSWVTWLLQKVKEMMESQNEQKRKRVWQ